MQSKNTEYQKVCSVCGTIETKKWYKNENNYICQLDYRKINYLKNAEYIKKRERDKYHNKNKNVSTQDRYKEYKGKTCWQFHVRESNKKFDVLELAGLGISSGELSHLTVNDFVFEPTNDYKSVSEFICKYEWLGKMPFMPKYYFIAKYKNAIAGAVVFSSPYYDMSILGELYRGKELALSRGACSSWAPKHLNSALIMFAINYLAKNTNYCIFTAYSDTEAKEVGTIYQACNFIYMGQQSGTSKYFKSNKFPEWGWFTGRKFKTIKLYKKFCDECGITWDNCWSNGVVVSSSNIPKDTYSRLKAKERDFRFSCESRPAPNKHKYVYLLGSNKKETRILKELIYESHPYLKDLKYPKRK
jgi:hypothetical protein